MIKLRLPKIEATILPFGATLQSLVVPDRNGRMDDVLLGHDTVDGYLARRSFYGATIGRFANRIAGGRFGDTVIPANDGQNALHGGSEGFDRRVWEVVSIDDTQASFGLHSPDGDQGFQGNLRVQVKYELETSGINIEFIAETDHETPVNLTNHSFFNLGGNLRDAARMKDVMAHELTINASRYLPVTGGIPEGAPVLVEHTPFDFRKPQRIGGRIRDGHPQLKAGKGYDHNFCLDGEMAAELYDPASGRVMQVWTNQPGLQFYSGNFLDGTEAGKGGLTPRMGDALCLEPQLWPDSPNRPDFPNAMLQPGQIYCHRMRLSFSTR